MIRAMAFDGPGRPLRAVELPTPTLAPGEAIVEVRLTTLCGSDLHTYFGHRGQATPTILGHEIVGTVAALNGDVALYGDAPPRDARVGDRVIWPVCWSCRACEMCRHLPQKCERLFKYGKAVLDDSGPTGGLSTHVRVLAGTPLFLVPDAVPDEIAAPAMCAGGTVVAAWRAAGGCRGSALVVGGGMLGLTLCAMLADWGLAAVTLADPDPARRELGLAFGATECVERAAGEFDTVYEFTGSLAGVRSALAAAAVGGTVVLAGSVSPAGTVALDPEVLVRRCLTVRGVHNYAAPDLRAALDFLAAGGRRFPFAGLVAKTFPLAEADAAFAYAADARPVRVGVRPV